MASAITLTSNEIFSSFANVIVAIQPITGRAEGVNNLSEKYLKSTGLLGNRWVTRDANPSWVTVGQFRKGYTGAYGGGKSGYSTDLLTKHFTPDPFEGTYTINQVRQIRLTLETLISGRAWMEEGSLADFNSMLHSFIGKAKKMYLDTLTKAFIGTQIAPTILDTAGNSYSAVSFAGQLVTVTAGVMSITLPVASDPTDLVEVEAQNRMAAQLIGKKFADLEAEISDYNEYNPLGYTDSYSLSDFDIYWNPTYANTITYIDLPTIYHKDGIVAPKNMLHSKYFMKDLNLTAHTTVAGEYTAAPGLYAGVYLRGGVALTIGTVITAADIASGSKTGKIDTKVICKLVHKDAVIGLANIDKMNEFYNAADQDNTFFSTFGYGLHLQPNFPVFVIKEA